MSSSIKLFTDELEKASIKDASNAVVMFIAGPRVLADPDGERSQEYMQSIFALAKVGMVAVFAKAQLVPLLVEGVTPNDDTTMEDDLLITTK